MRKNKENINGILIQESYIISRTGELQQYYTLYRDCKRTVVGYHTHHEVRYLQNLGHDFEESKAKARKIIKQQKQVSNPSIDEYASGKKDYVKFEAFGLDWHNTRKGYTASPNREFWNLWRKDKIKIKELGFSVFKNFNEKFVVFFNMKNSINMEVV